NRARLLAGRDLARELAGSAHHALDLLHRGFARALRPEQRVLDAHADMQTHGDRHGAHRRDVAIERLDGEHGAIGRAARELDLIGRVEPCRAAADRAVVQHQRPAIETTANQPYRNASASDKVRKLVWLQLASGRCTVEQVAGRFGVNRRTLHRRLAAEKLTFSGIVEAVRREIVTRTLASRGRSLSSLAGMLGFSGMSLLAMVPYAFRRQPVCMANAGRNGYRSQPAGGRASLGLAQLPIGNAL